MSHPGSAEHLHIIFNAHWEALDFTLPDLPADQLWHRLVDTVFRSPEDLSDPPQPLTQGQNRYTVWPRSTAILTAEQEPHEPARATYPQARTVTSG